MEPARWKKIDELFHGALALAPDERENFLARACADDDALRREVDSLLASFEKSETLDQKSVVGDALQLIAGEYDQQKIGPYRLIREIGQGGMGEVHLACRDDAQYEKQVAIKLIRAGMDNRSMMRRFQNERQILASFDHPNIARLLDGGATENGQPYFVMEYIEGLPIDQYCDSKQLSIEERLHLFRDICSAVHYAHQRLVIHRDIKPGNILVTSDGQAKLLDFGIAKLLAPPDTPIEQDETLTHAQMMTPRYASPEQLRGEPITTASDVYSLGVVLYELLTGRSPYRFTSRSPIEIAREVIETEPDRPSDALLRPATGDEARGKSSEKLRRQLAGDLDNMVLKALRKEKERRYSSVQELSEDIRRYLEGRPVSARRDTFRYRASKFIARNKFATAAAALFVLALIAGILTTAWQARVARAEKDRAERRFNDVRKLARSVVFDYHDRIVDLPGSTPVREILIRDALEYLGSLAREATGDSSLQIELADAYEKISSVQGGAGSANIGDTPGAIESRRKAIEIRESLLASNPENENLRVSLSTSYSILAGLLSETEDVEGALDNFAKAIRIAESLIGEDPQRIENRFLLAGNLGEMAAFLIYLGKWDGAKENARRSLEIYQSLVADNPQHQLHRRELSLAYERAAQIMLYTDDMEGALANQRKAVEIRESLANQFPERRDYKSLLGAGYYYLGDVQRSIAIVLKRKEYLSQSLDSYRKSAAIGEQLAADDPMNAQHLTSNVDISIGSVLEEMGRFADASASYRKALANREKWSRSDPGNYWKRWYVIEACAKTAKATAKAGDATSALDHCRKAASLIEGAGEAIQGDILTAKAAAYIDMAEAYATVASGKIVSGERIERWQLARRFYQQGLEILLDMKNRGTLGSTEDGTIEEVKKEIARCDAALARGKPH